MNGTHAEADSKSVRPWRRPLIAVAGAVILGVLLADNLPLTASEVLGPAGILALAAGFCLAAGLLLKAVPAPKWGFLAALLAIAATSTAWTTIRNVSYQSRDLIPLLSTTPRILRLSGYVHDMPEIDALPARDVSQPDRAITRFVFQVAALLTGDIDGRGTELLLARQDDAHADIFQVPHHGRKSAAEVRFAARVKAEVALISGGQYSPRPSPYAAQAQRLFVTEDCGMIVAELAGDHVVEVRTFMEAKPGGN